MSCKSASCSVVIDIVIQYLEEFITWRLNLEVVNAPCTKLIILYCFTNPFLQSFCQFLVPFGLPSWILDLDRDLLDSCLFVLVSSFYIYILFLVTSVV